MPYFYVGLLDEGSHLTNARNPSTRLVACEGGGAIFLCEWER